MAPEQETAPVAGNQITIDNVTKVFGEEDADRVVALENVHLTVNGGEFAALLGASGCGKTTLLRILAGLESPTTGQVRIGADEIRGPSTQVGFVFQHSVLLPWLTVMDNVLLPVRVRKQRPERYADRARELLETSGLAGFENHHPPKLSGGMRQRVAICRALLLDPDVLLMDEPFGALDAMTRDAMNAELFSLWQETKKTIVLVTHSITEAVSLATRVAVMSPRPGRVVNVHEFDLPAEGGLGDRISTHAFADAVTMLRGYFQSTP